MAEEPALGGVIDDYCTRCQAVMNHSIVSLANGEPARTECRTCYTTHKYRRARGARKRPGTRSDLFDEVLGRMGPFGRR